MPTTSFTVDACVLNAMLAFAVKPQEARHPILQHVLAEITPQSVRLVSTNTFLLGLLNLTPISGMGFEVQCEEPTSIVLPVIVFQHLLKDRQRPILLTIDGLDIEVRAPSGTTTVTGLPADEYPTYTRVLPEPSSVGLERVAFDLELLDRFSTFAKRIGYGPHLEMGFHRTNGPTSVRVQGLSSFYGICMPRQLVFDEAMPRWVQSQVPDRQVPTDEVFLSQIQGEAHLSGVDQHDRTWVQFEVDPLAEQAPGACSICGVKISAGWQCGDGGDEVCGDHVRFTEDMPNLPGIAEAEEPEPGVVAA